MESEIAVEHLLVAQRLSPIVSVGDLAFMTFAQFMNGNMALSECLMEMERVYIAQQRMLISKNSLTKLCLYERTI
ncbi:MAG: hypothetical protein ACI845_002510, partial [Gammaproteobacteria bacterium]